MASAVEQRVEILEDGLTAAKMALSGSQNLLQTQAEELKTMTTKIEKLDGLDKEMEKRLAVKVEHLLSLIHI